jgi:hypothetical protein
MCFVQSVIIGAVVIHSWPEEHRHERSNHHQYADLDDYEAPDALDLPWDSEAATRIIPYRF